MSGLLLRGVEVDGINVDVRVRRETVAEIGPALSPRDEELIDGGGGALLPGLHDHHLHLRALAALQHSLDLSGACGSSLTQRLRDADRRLPAGEWLRAVGWHQSAGSLDRDALDAVVPDRPVRVQHRSGALWVLNSAALRAVGVDEPTGRLFGRDRLLRDRIQSTTVPDLGAAGHRLASCGVTGVTDATPIERAEDAAAFVGTGLRVVATGAPPIAVDAGPAGVEWGPAKIVVADHHLPTLDELVDQMRLARRNRRCVAVHCVTREALVLALAAWEEVAVRDGDRVEHGSIIPDELVPALAERGLTVVTQPNFVAERGDDYLAEVAAADRPFLYRFGSLLESGVRVGCGTDAPFGDADPWKAMRAAVERRTASGAVLGEAERVEPRHALRCFLADPGAPGGPARRVIPGAAADLVLLDVRLADALADLSADRVRLTIRGGHIIHRRGHGNE
jgi:predicted amidohydrolase YtcJ